MLLSEVGSVSDVRSGEENIEVRVLDANLSLDLSIFVEHCDLRVPLVNVYAEVHLFSLRDADA
jgi:hypothetical protein